MIHKIEIGVDSTPEELRKIFRKRLMTGGAVIRLQEGLSEAELNKIVERFLPDYKPHNVSSMVLKQVSLLEKLPNSIVEKLTKALL